MTCLQEIILVAWLFLLSTQKLVKNWKRCLEVMEVEYYSSTADLWSSDAMEPYLGYANHYLNKQTWELQSACLQVHYTPEDHTGINLKQALAHTIEE